MLNSLSWQRRSGIRVSGEKRFGGEASQCFLKGSRYPRATVKIIVAPEHLKKFERAVETCRDVAAKYAHAIQKLAACRHKHAKIVRTLGRLLRGDARWVTDGGVPSQACENCTHLGQTVAWRCTLGDRFSFYSSSAGLLRESRQEKGVGR